jgi:hypothetical protein
MSKKRVSWKRPAAKNVIYTSDGEAINHDVAMRRYSAALARKHEGRSGFGACAACLERRAVHNDHTIAKARCKHIHKAELIYDPDNFEDSCEICHKEWESYQGGEWLLHHNCEKRLRFLKEHDPEGYQKRVELTDLALQQKVLEENRKSY